MAKKISVKVESPEIRNAVAVAMVKRYGGGCRIMRDRRAPRGGAKNKQRDYREETY